MDYKIKPLKKDGIILSALPAVLISTIILLVVFAIKGIFPFGSDSVAYMDMWQMNVPMYYHIYDVLHGDKALFYDFYTALGMNMSESVAICSLLSPFNLFMYLIPRNAIMHFLPIYTMLKIDFSVFFMSIFLRYKFKNTHNFWRSLASLAYGFCGLNMMFCTNSQWLDIAAFLPLLMLSLDYSLKNKKVIPYACVLALCFIINPYISVIALLFIFFAASAQVLFFLPKGEKTYGILNLGVGTVCGVAMSAFISIPFMTQMGKTARSPSDFITTIKNILIVKNDYTTGYPLQKFWMLWGTALACALIIYGIVLHWKNVKKNIISLICIAVVALQIFFENINLAWHGGSYVLFPMRFGFITSFIIWTVAVSYINDTAELNSFRTVRESFSDGAVKNILKVLWLVVCAAAVPFTARFIAKRFVDTAASERFAFTVTFFCVAVVIYLALVNKNVKNILRSAICVMLAAEVGAGAYLFIGKPYIDPFFQNTPDMEFAEEITETGDAFTLSDSVLSRIKNSDGKFTANYPFVMGKSALSNWTHTVDSQLQLAYKNFGYSIIYTRLLDTGGTVFSDALINVEDVITSQTLSQKSYTLEETHDDMNHYKTNYNMGFGAVMSSSVLNVPAYGSFSMQESLYNAMSGDSGLFKIIQQGISVDANVITQKLEQLNTVTYTLNITGCQNIYLSGLATMKIQVNGVDYIVPDAGTSNLYYPAAYNNALLDLGAFENETVTLTLDYLNGIDETYLTIALMNYDKLDALAAQWNEPSVNIVEEKKSGFELTAVGSDEKDFLLLPISYDDGLVCKVNGKKVEVENVYGCFAGVRLENGENTVTVKFIPDGMKKGVIIAAAGVLILLLYSILFLKRFKIRFNKTVETVVIWEYGKLWVIALAALYVFPILYQIFHKG